jgi:hypothetical protein
MVGGHKVIRSEVMSQSVSQIVTMPSIELLLIAGRAVALFVGLMLFAWAFRHWRRSATKDTQRVFEQLDLVRAELLIMKEVMHHAAHRVDSVAHTVTHDTRHPAANTGGVVRGYEIAARMARSGAAKEELIRSCGITSHEAELLIKLHGHRRDGVAAEAASLIGRQVREPQVREVTKTAVADQAAAAMLAKTQAAAAARQASAASETQRTPARHPVRPTRTAEPTPTKTQAMQQRSRLVAVG